MTVGESTNLRLLVACHACCRQYDAQGLAVGSRFHCACGETLKVPRFDTHDAAVVRCSSCGAPREHRTRACSHCGADFNLHEQDLHTVCPQCMTRVSDRSRFCHHCATPIVPQGNAGAPVNLRCPACGYRHKLASRTLGDPPLALVECNRCAGIWLSLETFDRLAERACKSVVDTAGAGRTTAVVDDQAGSGYRRCPVCRKHMNRSNYGKRSGVIVDRCRHHGIWFDAEELSTILRWVGTGEERAVADREADERRHRTRLGRIQLGRPEAGPPGSTPYRREPDGDLIGALLGSLFDL